MGHHHKHKGKKDKRKTDTDNKSDETNTFLKQITPETFIANPHDISMHSDFVNVVTQGDCHQMTAHSVLEPDNANVKALLKFDDVWGKTPITVTTSGVYDIVEITESSGFAKNAFYASGGVTHEWTPNIANTLKNIHWGHAIRLSGARYVYFTNFGTDFDFIGNSFSISIWIKPTGTITGSLIYRRIDANNRWTCDILSNNPVFEMTIGGTPRRTQGASPLVADQWNNLILTWNTATPAVGLYVNAVPGVNSTVGGFAGITTDSNLYIGTVISNHFGTIEGYIDHAIYYKDIVLNQTQANNLVNFGTII